MMLPRIEHEQWTFDEDSNSLSVTDDSKTMATRGPPKAVRSVSKPAVKTPGKDPGKGEKQPASVLEIVPGKFNESDWLSLLENDDTEDFIADIFESIWTDASKQIEQIYIRRQLLPYTMMITENALSNVIQWAFLERDEPKPKDGDFWTEDAEPIPCVMDNWGEGVVPACREEPPINLEPSPLPLGEQSITPDENTQGSREGDLTPRSLTRSPADQGVRTPRSSRQSKQSEKVKQSHHEQVPGLTSEYFTPELQSYDGNTPRSIDKQKRYDHSVLVIDTQPPRLEPLSDLFSPGPMPTGSSSLHIPTPMTLSSKHRRIPVPKSFSQLGSDDLASTTNITDITGTKSLKKTESKVFEEQRLEEVISRAPAAAHAMLKSIMSRPPGYRDLELDDFGNVIAIAKLDPDKLGPRSVRVKCDVVKQRKAAVEPRPAPSKPTQSLKVRRSDSKFAPVKLVLPEQSTEVGDLIQPVPGVLYEDSKLKKGDPRRYQTGMSKYTNFHDESRPLRPIARRSDLAVLQVANELLHTSKDYSNDENSELDPQIPKLHRLARIPPILSESSTSSA